MKRLILSISGLIFCWAFVQAQCIQGDCRNGTGIYLFPSGAKYIGQFEEGKMEGIGSCYYSDGSKYQGEWVNSYPEGNGIKTFPDGTQQRGEWRKGKPYKEPQSEAVALEQEPAPAVQSAPAEPTQEEQQIGCISGNCKNGRGIYIYPSGAIYTGDFKDGEIHGVGVCQYSDGSKYQGNWEHRYPHGHGIKTLANGSKWAGQWKMGQPVDAQGNIIENIFPAAVAETEEVDIQSGCVSGDCKNGNGSFAYADGSRYEGQFMNDKPNGSGTFFDVDGQKYVGTFKDGQKNGEGTLYLANGNRITGVWAEGSYIGQPASGSSVGCVSGNCQNGRGTYVSAQDGSRYTGSFVDGKAHGQGVVDYTNGERYSGNWVGGQFNGQGTLFLLDGTEVSGFWNSGTYMGESEPKNEEPEMVVAPLATKPNIKIWAVVVGVAAYNHMPTLRYTDDDAYRMFAFLKSPEGGALPDEQIRLLIDEDATKDRITAAMEEVFLQASPNDLVFLYYSGHGLRGAFLPIDFDGFNNRLEHDEINTILSNSPAKYKLCIADACHSGSLLAMRSGEVKGVLDNYYKTLAQAQAGTALIMSSKSEETSLESSGLRQGVFSHFLIRGLKGEANIDGDGVVSVDELFNFVNDNVRKYTGNRQSPVIKGQYDPKMPVGVIRQ